jgi:hypothetical protein
MSHLEGQPFTLTARHGLVLSWGAPVEEPLLPLCDRFFTETMQHWQRWVKHCDIRRVTSTKSFDRRSRSSCTASKTPAQSSRR